MKLLLLLSLLFSTSCKDIGGGEQTKPEPPSKPIKYKYAWENVGYDKMLDEAIQAHGSVLLSTQPKDWKDYIDEWPDNTDDLIKFWGNILVKMAYYESGWDTKKKYQENFDDRFGNRIWSRGLLQLSIESGRGYNCIIPNEQALHDPKTNLDCGVIILTRWVSRDKVISDKTSLGKWRGGARYWAVLRGNTQYTKKALSEIKSANRRKK
jgi:hypothetical protein